MKLPVRKTKKEIIKKGGRMMEKKTDRQETDKGVATLMVFVSDEVLEGLEEGGGGELIDQHVLGLLNRPIEEDPWELRVFTNLAK
jgi:hypothetical protein